MEQSKKDTVTEAYVAQLKTIGVRADKALLAWVVERVGPGNYNKDAKFVAMSVKKEIARVYKGFVADELGETNEEKGMKAIIGVGEKVKPIRRKYRAVVYYMLAKKYGKKID